MQRPLSAAHSAIGFCARLRRHASQTRSASERPMTIGRRDFIGTASALVAGMATSRGARAQEADAKPPSVPTRPAKVERLFKAPDLHPNALEAAPDGLWIGDQVSERVFKVDWQTGKVKIDPDSGKVLEIVTISRTSDPDPHGMCIHDGYMYYCDAGLTAPGPGSEPAQICRF